ncbi:hypothetical protein [Gimesia aquarii]|uniref:Uncharacterized protein n=1 Tax=Gimesia aquarii TaxID=2527964 RepID=A0A517VY27_9PLAN|nr:hypothetical protein [Gimesia aquarii]QDT97908.1 hypothetical protein V144x_33910 [Gimesia aquarii]
MSNTEILVEPDLEVSETDDHDMIPDHVELDHRSQEMLVVLNEVFDSIAPSAKS